MKNKIAKIIKECIDDYYRVAMKNEYQIAQEILDLLKQEGCMFPEEIAKEKMNNVVVKDEYPDREYSMCIFIKGE